ncbi:MAG: tRNA epoxyqueuosine(34) reductase QueG [Candidatus Marinimicrobia bacterium]|nr:tRNA epoxyqueuosine(34) reductase QueG [Candidatus Neomarinimicrobiota bacterium]MCF7829205.1 tRNA epoxyqueuosine(34) reductase QueG [Candidatus Neomarinimicrobiota bacterium]MCF7881142.1 tRNA epoxyqueuosine(34) reductase QueG [Candidatus Neomarinimicrobiota bacterium]
MNPYDLRQSLEQRADELGFLEFGIAKAEALDEEAQRLREYLDLEYHAGMQWMARNVQRRTDPRKVVPEAKSVIMLSYNYYTGRAPEENDKAKISNYAWGDDYHEVVTPKVRELEAYLHQMVDREVQSRSYVDTGPIMEKAWAARAGIGWIGKHTNLIHREHGSWFFLGAIICDVELEYDSPIPDFCGSCRQCIDACPTDAIVDEYVLDSNKCLSYLTIEHRGDTIPEPQSDQTEGWIYGCDICQNVCPWNNSFEHVTGDPHFQPRSENVNRDLSEWLTLTVDEYRERFRHSPIKRAKYEGILRNVRAALGQQHNAE